MHSRSFVSLSLLLAACGSGSSTTPATPASNVVAPPAAVVPATAEDGPPLDASAVPPGTGWRCFSTAPSMACFREAEACEAERDQRLAEETEDEPAQVYSECLELAEVMASTARDQKSGKVEIMFWTNPMTCLEDGSYYRRENPYYDQASGCASLP